MVIHRGLGLCILAALISACNLALPQVTPTVAPTQTPTTETTDSAELPTLTPVIQLLPTSTASQTPTLTAPPKPTAILPRSPTPTPTATVTTAVPFINPATLTPLPTLNPTELADLLQPREPLQTASPTSTAVPPPSTLIATPTYITATGDRSFTHTPNPSTPRPQPGGATRTITPSPTRFQPTVAVNPNLLLAPIPSPVVQPLNFNAISASVYQYDVGPGQVFHYDDLQLGGGVALFAPNPAAADSFIRTDPNGLLLYRAIGSSGESHMTHAPFFAGFTAASSDANKNRVTEIDWSADGQRFSFRIDTPPNLDNGAAGVWFWQPENRTSTDPTYQIIRDCAADDYQPCQFVTRSNANFWKTLAVEWSPEIGSYHLLLTVHLPEEGRNALAMTQAVRDAAYANQAPRFVRYDYGYWDDQGQAIIVSGRRPDGRVIIGRVKGDLSDEEVLFDASAAGLWLQNAVRRPDGTIVALGRPGSPFDDAPLALYDGEGRALSAPIGAAAPEAVGWYPDRSAVVLRVQGRQYRVQADGGAIADVTDLAGNPDFADAAVDLSPIPDAVIAGSEYFPGQQLRVSVGNLNIRQSPATASSVLGGLVAGDYVAVIAGPYEDERYRWWKVQTAYNIIGWIAGRIDERLTVRPA